MEVLDKAMPALSKKPSKAFTRFMKQAEPVLTMKIPVTSERYEGLMRETVNLLRELLAKMRPDEKDRIFDMFATVALVTHQALVDRGRISPGNDPSRPN